MVRRIGFGDGSGDRAAPVRRRGEAPQPAPEAADEAARRRAEWHKREAKAAHKPAPSPSAAPGPWIEAAEEPEPRRRRKGLSIGKLIILGFLWTILIRWSLASYGGIESALTTWRAAADGHVDPITALFPAILPLAVGIFVTQLILGRRKRQ